MLQPGSWIAQSYRVESLVGRGGMADVYKVWDQNRTTHLAMKRLKPELASSGAILARFREEARVLEQLNHPSIVRFYELVQYEQDVFLLMDYVEGSTLRAEIRRSPEGIAAARIREVLRPVCAALQFAHLKGRVHCDIKPENILIDRTGKTFISDFGITQIIGAASAGYNGGTPAYMAPEQIEQQRARTYQVTPQTDIYALGVLLFEMATGRRPFTGEHAPAGIEEEGSRITWEQANLAPPLLRQYKPSLPPAFEAVILRCLAKQPAQRFSGAVDLANAVESALSGAEVAQSTRTPAGAEVASRPRPPDGAPEPVSRPVSPKGGQPVFFAWAAVAVMLVAGLFFALQGRPSQPPVFPTLAATLAPSTLTAPVTQAAPVIPAVEKTYPYNACMAFSIDPQTQTILNECVQSITVRPDGKMRVNIAWKVTSLSAQNGVRIQADTNNPNMYLVDDRGNQLHHTETGGAANEERMLVNGQSREGWFLFPPLSPEAKSVIFVDDDNNGRTDPMERRWP